MIPNIKQIQKLLIEEHIDGWIFTDIHGRDPVTRNFLNLTTRPSTRRLFYFIPSSGSPVKLLSAIEPYLLDSLPGETNFYLGLEQQENFLAQLFKDKKRIAAQYSPNGNVPLISSIDAGTLDFLRSFEIDLISSGDLLQYFQAVLTENQIESHRQAGVLIHQILEQTFQWIRSNLNQNQFIDELMLRDTMIKLYSKSGLDTSQIDLFFGIDEHAADPGYEPTSHSSKTIKEGCRLIIDIAGRLPEKNSVFYDISWCMQIGGAVDKEYQRLFMIDKYARDTAVAFIKNRIENRQPVYGYEVDLQTQRIFEENGVLQYRKHRTGHNIGCSCHGLGANLDAFETHDDRKLIPGTLFSIEPGIYAGQYGVRSEIDVHITPDRKICIYGPVQDSILCI